HGVAYPAQTLYGHEGQDGAFHDVTGGANGYCGGDSPAQCGDVNLISTLLGLGPLDCAFNANGTALASGDRACNALPGYDGPSGLGTPNGLAAFTPTGPTVSIAGPQDVTLASADGRAARQ